MKRTGIFLTALLLAGCGGTDNEAADVNQATSAPVADASDAAPRIPDRFVGTWDATTARCSDPASEMRLTIEPRRLAFYESSGRVASLLPGEGDAVRVNVVLDGEGMTRERQFLLRLDKDGKLAVTADDVTTLRTACPATPPSADAQAPADANSPLLGVGPGELTLIDPNNGRTRHLDFGMAEQEAVDAVALAAGKPKSSGTNSECGAGPLDYASFANGVTAWSQNGQLVGWSLNDKSKITTMSGIGIGSTRTRAAQSINIKPVNSTLGEEFAAGDLHGLFDGKGASAKITSLWSGTVCNFR